MARAHALAEAGRWGADATPVRIEYALTVLERIRAEAVEGFCRFPRGGVEIGGVLFGNADGDLIRILDARPVPTEYAFGPSYTLSEKDQAGLRAMLEAAHTDPELTGMIPVGWYHSHTRSEVLLSLQDCEVHDRYFPGGRQVALVVKPEPFGSARAGFFVREHDGSVRTEGTYQEFVIPVPARPRKPALEVATPPPRREPLRAEPELKPEPEPPPPAPAVTVAVETPVPVRPAAAAPPPAPEPIEPVPAGTRTSWWVWAAGVAVLTAVAAVYFAPRLFRAPVVRPALGLRVVDSGGRLQISWRRDILPATEAQHASLRIVDGGENVSVPFDADLLEQGALEYPRRSDNVEVQLRIERPGGGDQEESVHFLGTPVTAAPAAQPSENTHAVQPVTPPVQTQSPGLVDRTPSSRSALPPATEKPKPNPPAPTVAAEQAKPRVFNMAALPETRRPEREIALPMPPEVEGSGSRAVQTGTPAIPTTGLRTAPPPPAPPQPAPAAAPTLITRPAANAPAVAPAATAPAKPAYAGPSSGRIIWTGDLSRGTSLSLSGRQASAGVATGEFPGVPVRVSVHPADLSGRGLTVYSMSNRPGREAPGPQNGWNATTYSQDARRAGELLVLESPGAQNSWKKIVLRNDSRDISVIVIDWKTAE